MFELIEGVGSGVVAVRAVGEISGSDYETVLAPAIEQATAGGRKARLLIELGDDFRRYEPSGIAADAALGLGHIGSFERLAVVTDVGWIRDAIELFGRLIPGEVRLFSNAESDAARGWIADSP